MTKAERKLMRSMFPQVLDDGQAAYMGAHISCLRDGLGRVIRDTVSVEISPYNFKRSEWKQICRAVRELCAVGVCRLIQQDLDAWPRLVNAETFQNRPRLYKPVRGIAKDLDADYLDIWASKGGVDGEESDT